ncbi:MAG TPA: GNAT family N-acetyltransferase [Dongiaceae bacterium]|nr:GNAT family N-acetyltransferase [Dongiaceae bacterium]
MTETVVRPLTPARWNDLERLFGPRGACAGCWCMYWRRPARDYRAGQGAGNRRALQRLVKSGKAHGLIAYLGSEPIGWLSLGPRDHFPRLDGSRILSPVDGQAVWSVTCLFIARGQRRQGLSVRLLEAAAGYAARRGARLLEGYPQAAEGRHLPEAFAWTGIDSAFSAAGFGEVARRSPTRPIMRRPVGTD